MEEAANDQDLKQPDPNGQQIAEDQGNASQSEGSKSTETTDFVEFEGVKVPQDAFERIAKERYKDAFEAFENKSKWQAENTRRAQELKAIERDALEYRRLLSERKQEPQNSYDAKKQAYVEKKRKLFPEVDPRFFESQFDDLHEMSTANAKETISPILEEQAKEWERNFLKEHPLIKPGDERYYQLVELVKKGYDPEHGYRVVYAKELEEQTFSERLKARDAEAKRKLQQSQKTSTGSTSSKPSEDEAFEKAWARYGGQ